MLPTYATEEAMKNVFTAVENIEQILIFLKI